MKTVASSLRKLAGVGPMPKMDQSRYEEFFGEAMPTIEPTVVGRHRLVSALRNKFGANYRSLAVAKDLIRKFDEDREMIRSHISARIK